MTSGETSSCTTGVVSRAFIETLKKSLEGKPAHPQDS